MDASRILDAGLSGLRIAGIALLMAGCASMAPPYEVPALPVSPVYASATTQNLSLIHISEPTRPY